MQPKVILLRNQSYPGSGVGRQLGVSKRPLQQRGCRVSESWLLLEASSALRSTPTAVLAGVEDPGERKQALSCRGELVVHVRLLAAGQ